MMRLLVRPSDGLVLPFIEAAMNANPELVVIEVEGAADIPAAVARIMETRAAEADAREHLLGQERMAEQASRIAAAEQATRRSRRAASPAAAKFAAGLMQEPDGL